MRKWLFKKILRLEHIIYCATNCKVEFLIHKAYYELRKQKYEDYLLAHDNYL